MSVGCLTRVSYTFLETKFSVLKLKEKNITDFWQEKNMFI